MKFGSSLFCAFLASGVGAIPSLAGSVTFGQGLEQAGGQDFHLVKTGSGVELTATSQIFFTFSNIDGTLPPGLSGQLSATLTLDMSSSTLDVWSNGSISEGGFSGNFWINLNTPVNGQTNLLSGVIAASSNTMLTGKSGGTSASFSASTPPDGAVVYTSAFVQFLDTSTEAWSLALSSVVPSFVDNGSGYLAPFDAAGSETFSSNSPSAVMVGTPEPVSILLMGFGMLILGTVGWVRRNTYLLVHTNDPATKMQKQRFPTVVKCFA